MATKETPELPQKPAPPEVIPSKPQPVIPREPAVVPEHDPRPPAIPPEVPPGKVQIG